MPRSEEKDVGSNISRLAKSHPEFGQKQRVAVAFSEARRAGGNPGNPGHEKKESKSAERKEHGGRRSMMRARVMRGNASDNGEG